MRSLLIVFLLSVCVPTGLCYAEDKEKEEEPKEILLDVESAYEIPHTRSLYSAIPEAVLQGTSVRVTFDEPLPYVDIRVLDAGSGAVVFASAYAYESEVELDLSGYPKDSRLRRDVLAVRIKNVMTINGKGAPGTVYLLGQMKSGCSATHLI